MTKPCPPRWAECLLEWYCKPSLLEDLQGDLNEYFDRNVRCKGLRRARFIYVLDVLKFFRPYTVRKPQFITFLIHWIMIGSYIKTSGRSLVRNKLFSTINILGLAVSMSVGLLAIAFLHDLRAYDDFHADKDRICRVITHDERTGGHSMNLACTSVLAGIRIKETIGGIDEMTMIQRGFMRDAIIGGLKVPVEGLWADEKFFQVFSFPLVQGNAATALKEPYSLVLTESGARKLFGTEDALGRSLVFDTTQYVVTAIARDVPKLSHIRFEALVSFSSIPQQTDADGDFMSWTNIYSNYIYLKLAPGTDRQTVQAGLDKLSAAENKNLENRSITLQLQPMKAIAIGKSMANPIGPTIDPIAVWVLVVLAAIVILSAAFNYTNLSIARALRRSREVGIRKVIGALRSQVMSQFMAESVLIALLALVISVALFSLLRLQFLSLHAFIADLVSLDFSFRLIGWFIALALAVGLAAGFLPALFFSKVKSVQVLKDASTIRVFRHVSLRKGLIVVQYMFSIMFITATLIGYRQYRSFLTFDLGFSTRNIINIKLQGNKGDVLAKELAALPEVEGISKSLLVTSLGSLYGMNVKYKDPNDSASVSMNYIDEQYLPLHDHQLLAGRNFTAKAAGAEESEVIVSQELLRRFRISPDDPAKAIGEQLILDKKPMTIIGVIRDFHYGTVEDKISPVLLRYSSDPSGYLNLKLASTDIGTTMASIDATWKKIDPVHPLEARFYDDQIEEAYSQFSVMIKVIGFLGFLAVCVASMGLFGMVVFTTETRLREISIRKVLGAGEGNLVYLLSRGFLVLLAVATLIALPLTYLFFDNIVLVNFAYHQPIGMLELTTSVAIVMVLAVIMIGTQTLKAARKNPALVLKTE